MRGNANSKQMFIKKAPNSHGWVDAKVIEDLWLDHFNFYYREYDEFVFPVTIHPDASGHPSMLLMLERFYDPYCLCCHVPLLITHRVIEYIKTKDGVEFVTMEEICDDFKSKNTPPNGAWLPAEKDAVLSNPGELYAS